MFHDAMFVRLRKGWRESFLLNDRSLLVFCSKGASTGDSVAGAVALDGHLQYCRTIVRVSLLKPTWELFPQPADELLAVMPVRPAGLLPVLYYNLLDILETSEAVQNQACYMLNFYPGSSVSNEIYWWPPSASGWVSLWFIRHPLTWAGN